MDGSQSGRPVPEVTLAQALRLQLTRIRLAELLWLCEPMSSGGGGWTVAQFSDLCCGCFVRVKQHGDHRATEVASVVEFNDSPRDEYKVGTITTRKRLKALSRGERLSPRLTQVSDGPLTEAEFRDWLAAFSGPKPPKTALMTAAEAAVKVDRVLEALAIAGAAKGAAAGAATSVPFSPSNAAASSPSGDAVAPMPSTVAPGGAAAAAAGGRRAVRVTEKAVWPSVAAAAVPEKPVQAETEGDEAANGSAKGKKSRENGAASSGIVAANEPSDASDNGTKRRPQRGGAAAAAAVEAAGPGKRKIASNKKRTLQQPVEGSDEDGGGSRDEESGGDRERPERQRNDREGGGGGTAAGGSPAESGTGSGGESRPIPRKASAKRRQATSGSEEDAAAAATAAAAKTAGGGGSIARRLRARASSSVSSSDSGRGRGRAREKERERGLGSDAEDGGRAAPNSSRGSVAVWNVGADTTKTEFFDYMSSLGEEAIGVTLPYHPGSRAPWLATFSDWAAAEKVIKAGDGSKFKGAILEMRRDFKAESAAATRPPGGSSSRRLSSSSPQPRRSTVSVTGVPAACTVSELESHLATYGKVKLVEPPPERLRQTDPWIVHFNDPEDAEDAIERGGSRLLRGQKLDIARDKSSSGAGSGSRNGSGGASAAKIGASGGGVLASVECSVAVFGMAPDAKTDAMMAVMGEHGEIVDVLPPKNRGSTAPWIVYFATQEATRRALEATGEMVLDGRRLETRINAEARDMPAPEVARRTVAVFGFDGGNEEELKKHMATTGGTVKVVIPPSFRKRPWLVKYTSADDAKKACYTLDHTTVDNRLITMRLDIGLDHARAREEAKRPGGAYGSERGGRGGYGHGYSRSRSRSGGRGRGYSRGGGRGGRSYSRSPSRGRRGRSRSRDRDRRGRARSPSSPSRERGRSNRRGSRERGGGGDRGGGGGGGRSASRDRDRDRDRAARSGSADNRGSKGDEERENKTVFYREPSAAVTAQDEGARIVVFGTRPVDLEKLRKYMEEMGEVVMIQSRTNANKPFWVVHYRNRADGDRALMDLPGTFLDGVQLTMREDRPFEERQKMQSNATHCLRYLSAEGCESRRCARGHLNKPFFERQKAVGGRWGGAASDEVMAKREAALRSVLGGEGAVSRARSRSRSRGGGGRGGRSRSRTPPRRRARSPSARSRSRSPPRRTRRRDWDSRSRSRSRSRSDSYDRRKRPRARSPSPPSPRRSRSRGDRR